MTATPIESIPSTDTQDTNPEISPSIKNPPEAVQPETSQTYKDKGQLWAQIDALTQQLQTLTRELQELKTARPTQSKSVERTPNQIAVAQRQKENYARLNVELENELSAGTVKEDQLLDKNGNRLTGAARVSRYEKIRKQREQRTSQSSAKSVEISQAAEDKEQELTTVESEVKEVVNGVKKQGTIRRLINAGLSKIPIWGTGEQIEERKTNLKEAIEDKGKTKKEKPRRLRRAVKLAAVGAAAAGIYLHTHPELAQQIMQTTPEQWLNQADQLVYGASALFTKGKDLLANIDITRVPESLDAIKSATIDQWVSAHPQIAEFSTDKILEIVRQAPSYEVFNQSLDSLIQGIKQNGLSLDFLRSGEFSTLASGLWRNAQNLGTELLGKADVNLTETAAKTLHFIGKALDNYSQTQYTNIGLTPEQIEFIHK